MKKTSRTFSGQISFEHKYGEIPLAKEELWTDVQHGIYFLLLDRNSFGFFVLMQVLDLELSQANSVLYVKLKKEWDKLSINGINVFQDKQHFF